MKFLTSERHEKNENIYDFAIGTFILGSVQLHWLSWVNNLTFHYNYFLEAVWQQSDWVVYPGAGTEVVIYDNCCQVVYKTIDPIF